jgi:hypothetical protein
MTFILATFTKMPALAKAEKCAACGNAMTFKYMPMPEWNIAGPICSACYGQKLLDHYISPDRRDVTKK